MSQNRQRNTSEE